MVMVDAREEKEITLTITMIVAGGVIGAIGVVVAGDTRVDPAFREESIALWLMRATINSSLKLWLRG